MKKKGIVKSAIHCVEYSAIIIAGVVFSTMPVSWVWRIVRILGFIAFNVFGIRREVTFDNLRKSFLDADEKELLRIAGESYVHIGMTFVELLLAPKISSNIFKLIDLSEIDIAKRALDRGKGLILIACHFGSWELNGGSIAASGFPVTVAAKSQPNPLIDNLVTQNRTLYGMKIITKGAPVKHMVRALRDGKPIGLISDQDSGSRGVFVDFFGRKASTPKGAAQLAIKYNAPVVVVMTARLTRARYKTFFREVDVHPDDTVESLTQRYTSVMEEIIRRYPEQYFWMHRRWKTSPPEQVEDG